MKVVTAQQMCEIDRITIEDYGIASLVLMERAGLAVAKRAKDLGFDKKIVIVCGGGNNGGDGIVAARNLYNWGFRVKVLILSSEKALSPECHKQFEIARKMGIPMRFSTEMNERDIHGVTLIIDAIFGTGLNRDVKDKIAKVIRFINSYRERNKFSVLSIDIPSGISSDTGAILGEAINADFTVTFGVPKVGHFLYPGADHRGKLFIEDIGFPTELLRSEILKISLIDEELISNLIPERPKYSHKGDYGHVLIVGGSKGKTGAPFMASRACMRSGSGLVTIGVPESLFKVFQEKVIEEMTLPLIDKDGIISIDALEKILDFVTKKADVLAIGPGMGISSDTISIMDELILKSSIPIVIDADGLNSLSTTDVLKKAKAPIILTPHPGEMARLLGLKTEHRTQSTEKDIREEIEKDRINTAISFSKETGTYVILKGVPTIIADPEGNSYINTTGNPGMATAGTGDVLTGIVASFLGQGLSPLDASLLGVYIHGLAGDLAASEKGYHSLIATDIINFLPKAFLSFSELSHG
jgi:NAD(P)H-hydrate epimerase